MNNMKTLHITILSIVTLALVAFMVLLLRGDINLKKFYKKAKLVYSETYNVEDVKSIDIDVTSSDINIVKSSDDNIKVEVYTYSKDDAKLDLKDNRLSIVSKQTHSGFVLFGGGNKVIVYVPDKYEGKFDIESTSGDVYSKLDTYNDYKIKLTSGDIEITNLKSLEGQTTSGDVELGKVTSYIDYKTTSGDYEIESIKLEKDSYISATSGDVEIEEVENAYIETSVKSGDVKIEKNDRKAEYVLKIKTTSGDIEVR